MVMVIVTSTRVVIEQGENLALEVLKFVAHLVGGRRRLELERTLFLDLFWRSSQHDYTIKAILSKTAH